MTVLSQTALLTELEPVVEKNLDRHLSLAKEWFPHEYVPWSEGRTFDGPLGGEAWSPEDSTLPEVARTALIVNLLTEDNLPSYHHEIATLFGRDGAWGTWVHRWTAEEGRHGTAIRDYLTVTRAVDPVALERARMVHMSAGYQNVARPGDAALAGVRVVPGAGDPHLAPQHRPGHRRPDVRGAAGPGRGGREPAHGLLPQPARRGVRAGAVAGHARGRRRAGQLPDAGRGHRRLRPQVGGDRAGRHLRPAPAPRRRGDAGAAPVEPVRRDRPERRRRGRPRPDRRPPGHPGDPGVPLRGAPRRPSRPPGRTTRPDPAPSLPRDLALTAPAAAA